MTLRIQVKLLLGALLGTLCLEAACGTPASKSEICPPDDSRGLMSDEQRYDLPVAEVWKAVEASLDEGDFKIERRRRDDCGGKISARRGETHRITVTVHAPQRMAAEVAVYVEPGDRQLVERIQAKIGEKLSLKKARADLFGDTSLESAYEIELELAAAAAERTCRTLQMEVLYKHVEPTRIRIEARDSESRPVRFAMTLTNGRGDETGVVLSTEATPAGDQKEFLRKVRREFERHLNPSAE